MEIRVFCIKGWHDEIAPDRIAIEIGWYRWMLDIAGRCYQSPREEIARNAGLAIR